MTSEPQSAPTILLVEDEPSIRSLIRRMLEGAGYDLIVAKSGDEGWRLQTTIPARSICWSLMS